MGRHSFILRAWAVASVFLLCPEALGPLLRPKLTISCRPLEESEGRETPFGDICAPGEQLFLGVEPTTSHRYFAAFALSRVEAAHWFFPRDEEDESVDAQPELGFHWIATETPIDDLKGVGEHRIVALFSRTPLDRKRIRDAIKEMEAPGVIVIEKKILLLDS